jgi:hypothetical protein
MLIWMSFLSKLRVEASILYFVVFDKDDLKIRNIEQFIAALNRLAEDPQYITTEP